MKVIDDELRIRIADADALRDSGKLDEALPAYQAIVAEAPGTAEGWYKLGTAFGLLQDSGEAERCYREALTLWSDFPQANNNLGLILAARGELDAAERHYRVALAEDPDRVEAHLNLGTLFQETGRLPEAQYLARRAMLLKPDSAIASDLLGRVKKSMGRISEAIQHAESAVELDPKFAAAWTNLGACYWNCGRHRDAERALSTALALAPDFLPAWNNLLLSSNYSVRNRDEVFRLHRSFGDIVRKQCGDIAPFSQDLRLDPDRRLRIGFISGDLRRHSVTYFLPGALRNLDRSRFQLFAYFNFRAEDEVTWSLKPIFHQWKSIFGLPDQKASGFCYEPHQNNPTFTMTAAGLLAMQVCGEYESPLVAGAADWLLAHPPKWNERFCSYGTYYYAQGMYQRGGEHAKTAEQLVQEMLLEKQSGDGSWLAENGEERNHGAVYCTSMAVLSLSVKYHYLPIYQK
mgnify:CR=1 FL=1